MQTRMDRPEDTYRFPCDKEQDWVSHLDEHGYVVVTVASPEEVETARNLFWDFFEANKNVKRDNYDSWKNWQVDRRGIVLDVPTIQSEGAWFCRGHPKVKQAFAAIWGTDDLLVSMDSLLLWKPWWVNKNWVPRTEGLHMDQNPFSKPGKECVQGMLCLYDVTPETGGLQVVPGSHLKGEEYRKNYPSQAYGGDFLPLPHEDPMQKQTRLRSAKAGDLILWDSRTVHGGLVGEGKPHDPAAPVQLARMTQTVCMTPRSRASDSVLKKRKEGFENGYCFSHWPHEAEVTSAVRVGKYTPIELTEDQRKLL